MYTCHSFAIFYFVTISFYSSHPFIGCRSRILLNLRLRYVRYLTQCVILLDVTGFTFIALAELSIHDAMRRFSNYNILVYFNCYVCRLLLLLPDISNSMNSICLAGSQHCIEFYEFDLSAIPNSFCIGLVLWTS